MNYRGRLWLALGCLVFALAPCRLFGQVPTQSLSGIRTVHVVVDISGTNFGVTEDQMRTDIELKLRLAGMRVDQESKAVVSIGATVLETKGTAGRSLGGVAYIDISLIQSVMLYRDPTIVAGALTWTHGTLIAGPDETMREQIRNAVKDEVDIFLNAWLSANPK